MYRRQPTWKDSKLWAVLRTFIGGAGVTFGFYILDAAFGGALGNFVYDLVKASPQYFSEPISALRWFAALIIAFVLTACAIWWLIYQDRKIDDARLFRYKNLADLEERQLILMGIPGRASNGTDELSYAVTSFLNDIADVFSPDFCRALILRPDENEEYLQVWAHRGWDANTPLPNNRFYIGPHANRPTGVAGYAYWKRGVHIVTVHKKGGKWVGDHIAYASKNEFQPPSFRSFVVVPFYDTNNKCLGVISIDSQREETFTKRDGEQIENMLHSAGVTLASIIVIYERLEGNRHSATQAPPTQAPPTQAPPT